MKRLSLFSFYSQSGAVRAFIYYYLAELSKAAEVIVIVNGSIRPESKKSLEAKGYRVFCRENRGFDFGAWKEFLLSHDGSFFAQYDELILCNCSCYGPVYPFQQLFDEMDRRECDFWGLYRHPGLKDRKRTIPPHLQSYFLVIRQRLFHDRCFREYFGKLPYAASWDDAVKEEMSFTRYFEEKGFASSSYLGSVFSEYIENPTIFMPAELLSKKFPLVKRKCFTTDYSYINKISSSFQIKRLLSFLESSTDYPDDCIYGDLLQTLENSHLIKALGLSFVLPRSGTGEPPCEAGSVAALICSRQRERIPELISHLKSLPVGSSVCIAACSEEIRDAWTAELPGLGNYSVEIRLQEQGGSSAAALFLSCRDVISSHEYVCLLCDSDSPPSDPPIRDRFFSEHCLSSLLFSKEYVRNILSLFRKNERLGLLMPFVPMFSEWPQKILNEEWGSSREEAERIYSMLKLTVPFDCHPVAPWGGMFWLRGRAISALYRHDWTNDELEPVSAREALLRLYPMIAQESGFFSGCVCPQALAGSEFSNMYFNLQKYSAVKIESGRVHFSDVKKVLGLYLKRKFPGIFRSGE
ncbi:MAG: rhamnan synthesis F family protein [Succinivibrionaceae bacterium]|nr:rhamnan synthesis F family protein [Succinivibrionaceae bacterium]